jgi:hypothetical protein
VAGGHPQTLATTGSRYRRVSAKAVAADGFTPAARHAGDA